MLHENAKQRLYRVAPTEFDLTWFDPLVGDTVSDTINLSGRQVRWFDQDAPIVYPCVVLGFRPEGRPRGEMGHVFENGIYKEPQPQDDDIAYKQYSVKPMTAELQITVAANQDHRTPEGDVIPRRVVADTIAMDVFHEFEFHTEHLLTQGVKPNGEELEYAWPMEVRSIGGSGIDDTSGMLDEQSIQRRSMHFRVEYFYFAEEDIPATRAIRYDLRMDRNRTGEFDTVVEDREIRFIDDPEED